jgi:hypothetical protein
MEETMYEAGVDLMTQVAVPIVVGVGTKVLGDVIVAQVNKQKDGEKLHLPWFVSLGVPLALAVAVFAFVRTTTSKPVSETLLQSVQCEPCSVKLGDPIAIIINLNRAVPPHGPAFLVHLKPSDGAVVNGNSTVEVEPGDKSATTHFTVDRVPPYLDSIKIGATDDANSYAYATINVLKEAGTTKPAPPQSEPRAGLRDSHVLTAQREPAAQTGSGTLVQATIPAMDRGATARLDPELVGRLEEAQGGLSAENSYWENMKKHMPPGSSLRPEITSQLYAATSASQRCTEDRQRLDSASLKSCIDALNDHLNQLRIQH